MKQKPSDRAYVSLLHLFGLVAIVIAQPLFAWVSGQAEFLVAHNFDGPAALALVGTIGIALPLLLWLCTLLALPFGRRPHLILVSIFVGALAGMLGLQWSTAWSPLAAFALAAVIAVCAATAYARVVVIREVLTYLSLAGVIVPIVFLATNPVREMLWADSFETTNNNAPSVSDSTVVFLVLDELPLSALLNPAGEIDAERFPGFAALAESSTWFPNAKTVSVSTTRALPTLLTGNMPDPDTSGLARWQQYPQNLFTWFARHLAGGVRGFESITRLCPQTLCAQQSPSRARSLVILGQDMSVLLAYTLLPQALAKDWLPPIDNRWHDFLDGPRLGDFAEDSDLDGMGTTGSKPSPIALFRRLVSADRAVQWRSFNQLIEPGFNFLHVLLPHDPYVYLSRGRTYKGRSLGLVDGRWQVAGLNIVEYQRMLTQLQFTDQLLLESINDLKARGMWDSLLLVVASDHGKSFRQATHKRKLDRRSLDDLLSIPLFIKPPHQMTGRSDPYPARITDIAPTIAALAGHPLPNVDGINLFNKQRPERSQLTVICVDKGCEPNMAPLDEDQSVHIDLNAIERTDALAWKWQKVRFDHSLGLHIPRGPSDALIGRSVNDLNITSGMPSGADVEMNNYADFITLDPDQDPLPAMIQGYVDPEDSKLPRRIGVAVNDRLVAMFDPITWKGQSGFFTALIADSVLSAGRNKVMFYEINDTAEPVALVPLNDRGVTYRPGDRLIIAGPEGSQAAPFLGKGWGGGERRRRWTSGSSASIFLELDPIPPAGATLRLLGHGYLARGEIAEQRVTLRINGEKISEWPMTTMNWHEIEIPADIVSQKLLHLEFSISNPASPCDFGHSSDCRTLGMALRELQLVPKPQTSE